MPELAVETERYIIVKTLVGRQLRGETFMPPKRFDERQLRRLLKTGAIASATSREGQDAEADQSFVGLADDVDEWDTEE